MNQHREELGHLEELYMGRLRAKDLEIESLEDNIRDKEVVANDKLSKTRQQLASTEKSVAKKIELEYSRILD